jgi:hypothetical protein
VRGYRRLALVCVAAKLGLADLLADGPRASDDLAQATQCHGAPSVGSSGDWWPWECSSRRMTDAGPCRRLAPGCAVITRSRSTHTTGTGETGRPWADSVANTSMGRQSCAAVLGAGFSDVTVDMHAGISTSYVEVGGALEHMAAVAASTGALTSEEADARRAQQRRRGASNRTFVACPIVYTSARRP